MKILLTGANGYIGMRLLPVLVEAGHHVICTVRDSSRFEIKKSIREKVEVVEIDFLEEPEKETLPTDIDAAYYLIHSMSKAGDFAEKEERSAKNFLKHLEKSKCKQVIYLSGIVNNEELSAHLSSRLKVEEVLKESQLSTTVLRAGIIVGSGSASFEIIRDLVEKLPLMVAPKWITTKCQPIAIRNVVGYLSGVLLKEECYDKVFDIGGPDVLTYREMLMDFAKVRGLKRSIISVPVMTPRLSSYWLYFVTATSYSLATNLVDSMKVDVVVKREGIKEIIPMELLSYKEAVELAFTKIEQHMVVSSWKDAMVAGRGFINRSEFVEVPKNGVFQDCKSLKIERPVEDVAKNIFAIGGSRGWYYGSFLWKIRGIMDKFVGGVGLRRGRTNSDRVYVGDALDFWRVIVADTKESRLLLYAEMKLPGEAWLEFKIDNEQSPPVLYQTATFRPHGLFGRMYWYAVLPFHYFVFNGMIRNLAKYEEKGSPKAYSPK
ncbi:SDR family oxidoreductase [Owenweeksia hongkongensis]|uniref:SDR family oxidoreductase n=1 Tax=Owenweeksia hongkongensis TaxID=253245 RepID=UPI003A9077AC